jgi:signal recognition particle GTPase
MSAAAETGLDPRAVSASVPAVRDLARRLLAQGASPGFAQRVVARVESLRRLERGEESAHPLDLAARVIGEAHPRVESAVSRKSAVVIAVLGARGAGRSTFARKLALRLCGARRKVAVLAVKQPGSTKPEWLAAWASEIGARSCVVGSDVADAGLVLRRAEVVIVDGSGEIERDLSIAGGATRVLAADAQKRTSDSFEREIRVAVLAADASPERLRADARALQAARCGCSVLMRLDLSATPAAAFEIAATAGLPVAFVSSGAGEQRDLHRSGPELAADVFLKGRIA